MLKVICDRCGNEIPKDTPLGGISFMKKEDYQETDYDYTGEMVTDLCSKCVDAIRDFATTAPKKKTARKAKPRTVKDAEAVQEAEDEPDADPQSASGEPEEPEQKSRGRARSIDYGKVWALSRAGRSEYWIADDMNISVSSVRNIIKKIRENPGIIKGSED